jgi:putative chitinase
MWWPAEAVTMITLDQLALIAGRPATDNAWSFLLGLQMHGPQAGLDRPHRIAHLLAQVLHESGRFRYDRELWGATPTAAQARYDARTDLGNTPQRDGDGYLYRGRGPLQ